MKEFMTAYKRPEKKPEIMDPRSKTEKAGYIPAKVQIESLINAGMRLSDYRREMYDYGNDEDPGDGELTITRNPNFDMADATQHMLSVEENIKAKKEQLEFEAALTDKEKKVENKDVPSEEGT